MKRLLSTHVDHVSVSPILIKLGPHKDTLYIYFNGASIGPFAVCSESLSKHDVDDSEYNIFRCNFAFLQSFLKSELCLQNVL